MPGPQEALSAALVSWNAGDLDGYLHLYDEGIRLHGYSPEPMGKAQVRGFYEEIFSAFDTPALSFGIEGDVDHPACLGDHITEHVTIAGLEGTGTWTVVEHDRPHHLALETELALGRLRISYQLAAVADGTRFQRDLDFPELGPQITAVMAAQSQAGVASLARLVERQIPA